MTFESSQSLSCSHSYCQGCFSETNTLIDELKIDSKTSLLWRNNKHLSNHQTPYALILVYYAIKTLCILKIYWMQIMSSSCHTVTWNKGFKNKFRGSKTWYFWMSEATLTKLISSTSISKIKLLKLQKEKKSIVMSKMKED